MKKRIFQFFILMFSVSFIVSSCSAPVETSGQTTAPTAGTSSFAVEMNNLMDGVQAASWPENPVLPDDKAVLAINRFSAGLMMLSAQNSGNVMISPASVFLALAMTANGADGTTREDMLKTLIGDSASADLMNQASRDWIASLSKTGDKTSLSIANSIWFNQGFEPDQVFLQTNADYFKAGATKLDFSDLQAPDVINAWVDENTRGLIKKIIEKINSSTVMFLINTVYFKSDWQTPFLKEETRAQTFAAPAGNITTDFMHQTAKMQYFTGNGASGVALPYDDGQFTYFALLPDDQVSPRDWLQKQDAETLFSDISALMAQKSNFTVELSLPKYEASFEDSLINELSALGMEVAFDGAAADFSRLNQQHAKGLYISEVKHKTFICVDEKGTEAAAATSVAIDESAIQADVQMYFDRPFIYGILDTRTGLPLFAGIMENPAAE